MIKNKGVLEGVRDTDYLAGILPYEVRNPTGDWTSFLPSEERQVRYNIRTQACVAFSCLNVVETQLNFLGDPRNLSDRYLAYMSGTTQFGNYLWKVADTLRKDGVVSEEDWGFPELSLEEYIGKSEEWVWNYYYVPPTIELINKAKLFLNEYSIAYEWIPTDKESLIYHLKHAPIQVTLPGHAVMSFYSTQDVIHYFDTYSPFKKTTPSIVSALKIVLTKKGMTNEQVRKLHVLFGLGLNDPTSIEYWTGKPLDDFLNQRVKDIKEEIHVITV